MRIKLGVLFLLAVIVIASAGMGISYATDELNTDGVPPCDVAFTNVVALDNEGGIEVAGVAAQIVNSRKGIDVSITNAYPGYEACINFTIENTGMNPIYVSGFSIGPYDVTALAVAVVPDIAVGTWLYNYGDTLKRDLTVLILDEAQQNVLVPYSFTVTISFKNESS